MIFPVLKIEKKIQVNEKTRINATKSYKTSEEMGVSLVRIRPSASDSFYTVTTLDPSDNTTWFLDWQYSTAGIKTIDLEITTDGSPVVISETIEVVTAAAENLFSVDADIVALEPDAIEYCKDGKNSLNDFHRQAQASILDELYRKKIMSTDGEKLDAEDVIDVQELKPWSIYMVLTKVFQSMSNKVDDVFAQKSKYYESKRLEAENMAMNQLRLDFNKDGNQELAEQIAYRTIEMVRG